METFVMGWQILMVVMGVIAVTAIAWTLFAGRR